MSRLAWPLLIPLISLVAFATPVTVTQTIYQGQSGVLTSVYFQTSSGPGSTTPSTNTAQSPPGGSGSYSVPRGSSAYLWSPQFGTASSTGVGNWLVSVWMSESGKASGSMTLSVYTTDSAGATVATIASGVTMPATTSVETEITVTVSGIAASIPTGGYIEVVLTAPPGGSHPSSFTIFWGVAQLTDAQVPMAVLST